MAFTVPEAVSKGPFNVPQPFDPTLDPDFLETTKFKVSLSRYPEEQSDMAPDDWSQGAKVSEVRRMAEYWKNNYDWKVQEVSLPV